ncbi:MAG TPA: maleylpyruvate isomerase N-terminal domain-containing protein [Dehalococcoidia bacterium]|nr:maleylpyruvate isomerase N-terminal domain-containing protein [Dehalococcoidia bacterium]
MTERIDTPPAVDAALKRLASAPERATGVALPLRPEAWDTPVAGEWTRRETLAHLASNDLRAMVRIRAALGEAGPEELAALADTDAWNREQVRSRAGASVEALLTEYRANRRALVRLLGSIPPEHFEELAVERAGERITLAEYVSRIDRHDDEHIAQIGAPPVGEKGDADAG